MSDITFETQVVEVAPIVEVVEVGPGLLGAPLSSTPPSTTGSTNHPGTARTAARADHVHATAMQSETLGLGDLVDVDTSVVASGDVLAFSGLTGDWRPTVVDGGNF